MPAVKRNFYDIVRDVMFELRLYMDLYEREVLTFIFGRTTVFFKDWEAISLRHFMEGIKDRDGNTVASPVAMTKPKLIEALKHLERKGIISVRRHPINATQYKVNERAEVNIDNVLAYMARNQRKQYTSIMGRHHARVLRPTLSSITTRPQNSPAGRDEFVPTAGTYTDQRVGTYTDQHNIPNIKTPILKHADPRSAVRRLVLPRKTT